MKTNLENKVRAKFDGLTSKAVEELKDKRTEIRQQVTAAKATLKQQQDEHSALVRQSNELNAEILDKMKASEDTTALKVRYRELQTEIADAKRWADALAYDTQPQGISEQVKKINSQLSRELWSLVSTGPKEWIEKEIAQRLQEALELIDAYESERVRLQGESEVSFTDHVSRRNQELSFYDGFLDSVKRNGLTQVMDFVEGWPNRISQAQKRTSNVESEPQEKETADV